ncbi:hypothetical protein [Treponema pedis]|uniref:hypothetical protein n=1 Tax=Treponema pedis TaxID=409322 RepID=UPI0031429ACA
MKENKQYIASIKKYKLSEEDVCRIKKIHTKHRAFIKAMQTGAREAFEIGQLLFELRQKDPAMHWKDIVKDLFPFSEHTANKFLRVYLTFKDNPKVLENLSKTEAYIQSGVKCLCAPKDKPIPGRLQTATDEEELAFDIEQIFKTPCVSKVKLENYRIETVGKSGRIWMIDRSGVSMPVAQLYATPPQGFPEAEHKELFRNVQIALELYFEKIEKYEKMGISEKVYQGKSANEKERTKSF